MIRGVFILAGACAALVRAQEPPAPILYIYREEVKPGRMGALVRIEEDAARFCATAHCPNPYVAIMSFTGPDEVWWINGFDSADTMDKVQHDYGANREVTQYLDTVAGQKADLVFPARKLLARYREDLSFSSGSTMGTTRFISISEVQVRPGQLASYEKFRNAIRGGLQRSGRPLWVYQVTSGADDTTFLIMAPGRTVQETHALGFGEEKNANFTDQMRDVIAASQSRLYTVSPSMSMPAQGWVEADPEFWKRP